MEINVKEVLMNFVTRQPLEERVPGSDDPKSTQPLTVGSALVTSLVSPTAQGPAGKTKPDEARMKYKLAKRVMDLIDDDDSDGKLEITATEAQMLQELVCNIYTSATVAGQLVDILDG